jgi:hypothetical protein
MHDDSVLVAIDAALRSPAFCGCGNNLTIAVHSDGAWLECATFASPTRLPARIAPFVRSLLHDRRFVVDVPAVATGQAASSTPAARSRSATPVRPGRAISTSV